MNQRQEMFVDDRFLVTYQNRRTGREHSVIVSKCDLMRSIEWHRYHGNLISYIPTSLVGTDPV
jgi:hypothetical protein